MPHSDKNKNEPYIIHRCPVVVVVYAKALHCMLSRPTLIYSTISGSGGTVSSRIDRGAELGAGCGWG